MGDFEFNSRLQALLIANSTSGFVEYVEGLLGRYEIETERCSDIYEAVGLLAKKQGGDTLVFGFFEQLNKEKGRFFQKLSEKQIPCCCFVERNIAQQQKAVTNKNNIFVVNKLNDIEMVLIKLLEFDGVKQSAQKKKRNPADFNADDFAATEAEIDALLGGE